MFSSILQPLHHNHNNRIWKKTVQQRILDPTSIRRQRLGKRPHPRCLESGSSDEEQPKNEQQQKQQKEAIKMV
jgi:hypothetical protein